MDELVDLPSIIWVLVAVVVVIDVIALVDLVRREVRHLPRWVWGLLIVASFPLGLILYVAIGRMPGPRTEVAAAKPDGIVSQAASATIVREGSEPPPAASASMPSVRDDPGPAIVSREGLGKRHDDTWALREVSLVVPEGAVYGLIGPNGAGKTTMLSILAGLRRPTEGTLSVAVPRSAMSVVIDTPRFEPWLSAREVVDLLRHLSAPDLPVERVEAVLEEVGLADAMDRRVGGFSRGMLQRVGLAAGLVSPPQLLVLDEPSSALDPAGRREVLDLIGLLAQRTTVLLSRRRGRARRQVRHAAGSTYVGGRHRRIRADVGAPSRASPPMTP